MKELHLLMEYIGSLPGSGLCIAFSGGVDSALLLKAATGTDKTIHAVTMHTPFHSPSEPAEATRLAAGCGVVHQVIRWDTMPDGVMDNPPDRCYQCKRAIFEAITAYAREYTLDWVLDGTNADDLGQYRPGIKALAELGIKSPLAELGFRKQTVRAMAEELGLPVADKPSNPCLATRFPYFHRLDAEQLDKVDTLEQAVRELGIRQVRARIHGGMVRLEVAQDDFAAVIANREPLQRLVEQCGYVSLTLDLAGFRSGTMDMLYRWDTDNM